MEKMQFGKGDCIVYGTNGICTIEDVRPMSFERKKGGDLYYILKPISSESSTIFVPLKNESLVSKMRELMDKEEIDSLLTGMRGKELQWEKDRRLRSEIFHEILVRGVHQELLLMIRCIYMRKRELMAEGKKLPSTDSNTLKAAEKLVEEEFAYVLDIEKENIGKYIRSILDIGEDGDDDN